MLAIIGYELKLTQVSDKNIDYMKTEDRCNKIVHYEAKINQKLDMARFIQEADAKEAKRQKRKKKYEMAVNFDDAEPYKKYTGPSVVDQLLEE
jgi:hypothetical protein